MTSSLFDAHRGIWLHPYAFNQGRNASCTECLLYENAKTVCLPAEGDVGGIHLVGEAPGEREDEVGRPFVGRSGDYLRRCVEKWAPGKAIVYDNACKCRPKKNATPTPSIISTCRGYLFRNLLDAKPERIIALGAIAAMSIFEPIAPLSVRKGYRFVEIDGRNVPVFLCIHPAAALRNKFVGQWFEEDLKWALTVPIPVPATRDWSVVRDADDVRHAINQAKASRWAAFDVETRGYMFDTDFRIISVAVAPNNFGEVFVWDRDALARPDLLQPLLNYMQSASPKVGQNVKYDMLSFYSAYAVMPNGVVGDTRLWRKLVESEAPAKLAIMANLVGMAGHKDEATNAMKEALKPVSKALTAEKKALKKTHHPQSIVETVLIGYMPAADVPEFANLVRKVDDQEDEKAKYAFALMPQDTLCKYNGRDAFVTDLLAEELSRRLVADPELHRVWDIMLKPAIFAFAQIEAWGLAVSRTAVKEIDTYLEAKIATCRAQMDGYAEPGFEWGSNKKVADLLYNKYGIACPKLTETGADSVDRETLDLISSKHDLPKLLVEYRRLAKFRSNYAGGLLNYVRADGRVHASYDIMGARSGRGSCVSPALQTIPRSGDSIEGKMARDCFVASPGNLLVSLDFGQLELRIAAMLSSDERMIAIFQEGVDYHQRTAELISKVAWGIAPEVVEKKHRSAAKNVNFGLLYGMQDGTLSKRLGCSMAEAGRIRGAVLGHFTRLKDWIEETIRFSKRTGQTRTYWNGYPFRKRDLWRIVDHDKEAVAGAEHVAVNSPIQGTASDYCLASVIEIVRWLVMESFPAKLVLTVHDSIILEVPEKLVEEAIERARNIMTGWPSQGVPLVVDVEVGPAWGSLRKLEK